MSHKLEQLYFKLEEIIGIQKHAGKVGKYMDFLIEIVHGLYCFQCQFSFLGLPLDSLVSFVFLMGEKGSYVVHISKQEQANQ